MDIRVIAHLLLPYAMPYVVPYIRPYVGRTIDIIGNLLANEVTICSLACFSGGLLFGPIGLAIGGVVGGLAVYVIGLRKQKYLSNY